MDYEDEDYQQEKFSLGNAIAGVAIGEGVIYTAPLIAETVGETLGLTATHFDAGALGGLAQSTTNVAFSLAPAVGVLALMYAGFRSMFNRSNGE